MKKGITIITIILILITMIIVSGKDTEEAMNKCIESGQSESWCEYHVYR